MIDLVRGRFGVLKTIGGPGSLGFLLVVAAFGGILLRYRRTRRLGRWVLTLLAAGYVVMSVPAVAQLIAGNSAATPVEQFAAYRTLDDIFVIDGDNRQGRAATAARLAPIARPRRLWIIGIDELKEALIANGMPDGPWEWRSDSALNTYDQMVVVRHSMRASGSGHAAVIVSRLQAERVRGIAQRANLDVIVVAAPLDREPSSSGAWRWVPSLAALALSREALYEWVAVAYYRRKGWM